MKKNALVLSTLLMCALSACGPANKTEINSATQETVVSQAAPTQSQPAPTESQTDHVQSQTEPTESQPAPTESQTEPAESALITKPVSSGAKEILDLRIDDRAHSMTAMGQDGGGIAVGILIDGAVAYTHCIGTASNDRDDDITPDTKFNVHPGNPFKISHDSSLFTVDGFKKAGISSIAFSPEESFAHPNDISLLTPESEDDYENVILPFKVTQAEGTVWASLNDVMRYLASNPVPDILAEYRYEHFSGKTLRYMLHGSGYTVSVAYVPSQKIYVIILENSIDLGIDWYVGSILTALMPDSNVGSGHYKSKEMNPQERRILYSLDKKDNAALIGKYQCEDGYRDFQIDWDGNKFVLNTDNWNSRIGGIDTYNADINKASVNDEGELTIEGASKEYRLLDAPVSDMRITPEFDENHKIISVTIGEERHEYELIGNTHYHSCIVDKFMTCKPIK